MFGVMVDVPHLASKILWANSGVADGRDEKAALVLGRLLLWVIGIDLWSCGLFAADDGGADGVDGRQTFGSVAGVVTKGELGGWEYGQSMSTLQDQVVVLWHKPDIPWV